MVRTFKYELVDETGVIATGIKTWEEILMLNKCLRQGCRFLIYKYPCDYPMQKHTALLMRQRGIGEDAEQERFL